MEIERDFILEIIKEVVAKWDPIGLMEFAPPDEYDNECCLIFDEYAKEKGSLGKTIYNVFKDSFGEEFQVDLSKCIEIATEMEERTSKC